MTDEERQTLAMLQKLQIAKMSDDELVAITRPHYNQLCKQGELRDNDTIDDRQLRAAQQPVTAAANVVVKLRLWQEQYRAKWECKDTYKADKWAHKDKVRQMRKDRRELVKSRKAANAAAKEKQRQTRKAVKAEKRKGKQAPNVSPSENAALDRSEDRTQKHTNE